MNTVLNLSVLSGVPRPLFVGIQQVAVVWRMCRLNSNVRHTNSSFEPESWDPHHSGLKGLSRSHAPLKLRMVQACTAAS